jgi:hypothetical protein
MSSGSNAAHSAAHSQTYCWNEPYRRWHVVWKQNPPQVRGGSQRRCVEGLASLRTQRTFGMLIPCGSGSAERKAGCQLEP